MEQVGENSKHIKHSILILYIVIWWIILFFVNKAPIRNTLYSFYNEYEATNSIESYSWLNNLPTEITEKINEIESYQFFKEHKYAEAIQAITGQSSRSYYNLGTLKTLRAYNQALGSTLSWLQKARFLIADAYKDFDTAEKIQLNDTLNTYIQTNKTLSQKLWTVIQVKACYGEYSATIEAIEWFTQQLDDTKFLLADEQKKLDTNRTLDAKCLASLKNINTASQTQLNQLQQQIKGYDKTYKSDFVDNIKQPLGCLNTSMTDIGPTISDAGTAINDFVDSHKNTIAALSSQSKDTIESLCNFAKNDSEMNEEISNSLDKLLEQLQNNLDKKQQQNKNSEENNKEKDSWKDEKDASSNTNIEYKNVFKEDELKLLQQIDTNNKSLIQQIQSIKWTNRYNAQSLLNKLFEDFYGEPSTFEEILQPSNSKSKW